jgi:hypothetical protein
MYIPVVGFEVLTAVSTKMTVFWVVAPCSLVDVYQRFRGDETFIVLMMEATRISETLVNFYRTTTQRTAIFIFLLIKL